MQDDEYATYLKRQTYDDLESIRSAFRDGVDSKRYEMVLAEIAERKARGEMTSAGWRYPAWIFAILAAINAIRFLTEPFGAPPHWNLWIHTGLFLLFAAIAVSYWRKGKQGKPQKAG